MDPALVSTNRRARQAQWWVLSIRPRRNGHRNRWVRQGRARSQESWPNSSRRGHADIGRRYQKEPQFKQGKLTPRVDDLRTRASAIAAEFRNRPELLKLGCSPILVRSRDRMALKGNAALSNWKRKDGRAQCQPSAIVTARVRTRSDVRHGNGVGTWVR
jgi:hypothetical protein